MFGGSVLLRDNSCQAGGEQQLGEPHLIADAAEQLPHLPSIPRPLREADLIPEGFIMANKEILSA